MNRFLAQLSESEVFSQLSAAEREQLADLAIRQALKKKEILCCQGDEWRAVLYIASGMLRSVINTPDGRQLIMSTWNVGEEFWSHTLLDGDPMPSTLEAVNPTIVYRWPEDTAYQMVLRNPNAARALIKRQTQLIRKRRESIYNLAFNPVSSRVAKLILSKYAASTDSTTLERDLTLDDMASMVATSPEVICRVLHQFQSQGFLQINRASIILYNRDAMEKLIIRD